MLGFNDRDTDANDFFEIRDDSRPKLGARSRYAVQYAGNDTLRQFSSHKALKKTHPTFNRPLVSYMHFDDLDSRFHCLQEAGELFWDSSPHKRSQNIHRRLRLDSTCTWLEALDTESGDV